MSAVVRLFAHAGIAHAFVASDGGRQDFHALTMLIQPYIAREKITADTAAAQSSAAALGATNSRVLSIQVDPGKRVHYEVNRPGREGGSVTADTSSPIAEGSDLIPWGKDWLISLLEAS